MRITERRLRQIIREEAVRALQEMPYRGSLGVAYSKFPDRDSYFAGESMTQTRSGAEKYARSGRFRTLAQKHLENIPHDVWFAPFIGVGHDEGVMDFAEGSLPRLRIIPLVPDGIKRLKEHGYGPLDSVGGGDTVILYSTDHVSRNFTATPWMIFHAIFDSGPEMNEILPSFSELVGSLFGFEDPIDPRLEPIRQVSMKGSGYGTWFRALTMASARAGGPQGEGDAFAEIMCQELLTRGGVRFNTADVDPEVATALEAIRGEVRLVANKFRRRIKGKLIIVGVN